MLPEPVREAERRDPKGDPDAALRDEIIAQLEANRGNVTAAAAALGKSRGHLHRLMSRLDIDAARYR